jgi:xanthine dehydrogenase large subunit
MTAQPPLSPLHQPSPHASAILHVTGAARYLDDVPEPPGTLHAWVVASPHAHAVIRGRDGAAARGMPGVAAVLFAADIPGDPRIGAIVHDEDVLAGERVCCVGHPVAVVVAETREQARLAAAAVVVDYAPEEAHTTLEAAVAAGAWLTTPHRIARGDVDAALAAAPVVLSGALRTPAQDHFYLETHAALAIPEDPGTLRVVSSTQHPTEVQKLVASALGWTAAQVTSEVARLGGGFGGKESQASTWAVLAAVAAYHTGRPVKLRLDRAQDMSWTGKRHPMEARWEAGFAADGRLLALAVSLVADGGWSLDLSGAILDRAMFHLDNAYWIPALRFEGRVARTHLPSNTAFRGFGGPQGMLVVEQVLEAGAAALGLDPAAVRRVNYYRPGSQTAPYGQTVDDPRAERIHDALVARADYLRRRAEIEAFNATARHRKRGIGLVPVKFGISFTNAMLNQAGALVHVYTDGSVQLTHGGVEMGQGLHTKVIAVVCDQLGVTPGRVRVPSTSTGAVPNTSATAASSGSDLNGAAALAACAPIRAVLREVAGALLGCAPDAVVLSGDRAWGAGSSVPLAAVAQAAWRAQRPLSSTGFYRTPGIGYDRDAGRGTPFFYYAWGAAVAEVEVQTWTGEYRLTAVDILHDVGDSLNPAIDIGQIEGGFVQGLGWLTQEEVQVRPDGSALTRGPSTYKIPSAGDIPALRVGLLDNARQPGTIGGSKAVGEPPLLLGVSVIAALRHAIAGVEGSGAVSLALPAHPEHVLRAVVARRGA